MKNAEKRNCSTSLFDFRAAPGLLDALNELGFGYRWSTRWIALDKLQAGKQLRTLRRQWFAKRKSMLTVMREVMFNHETALVDADAENKASDRALGSQARSCQVGGRLR